MWLAGHCWDIKRAGYSIFPGFERGRRSIGGFPQARIASGRESGSYTGGIGGNNAMIVVVGWAFEARIAAGPGIQVICSGDGRHLGRSLAAAVRENCGGLVSFGVAGGLHPDLQPGDCIVASAILSGSRRMPTDPIWSQNLIDTVPNAVLGLLAGVPVPVATAAAKRALHQKTGAVAVDMESHIAARVAPHTPPP